MTTLSDLRAMLPAGAEPVGVPDTGRPIAWARVLRARVPAFDALEPGDVAVVPLAVLRVVAPGPDELRSLVAACAGAGVAGLVVVAGEAADAPLGDALATAMDEAGLAGLRLPRSDVAALERSLIGYLVNERAELERQAGLLEERLARLALAGAGAHGLLAEVAGFLGRAVALEGPRGETLAVAAPPGAPAAAAPAARRLATDRARAAAAPAAARVPLPSPDQATQAAVGALVLLGADPASAIERAVVGRAAGLIALELARDEAVRRAADRSRRAESLPSAGPPWVVAFARQRIPGPADDGPAARAEREARRRELRLLAPARLMALRGDADSLEVRAVLAVEGTSVEGASAAAGPDVAVALELAGRMAAFLGRCVAVSRPFGSPADRPAAEAEARATLDAAEALPVRPSIARAERLAAYRLLGSLHSLPDGTRLAEALLAPLLTGRPDIRREHLATLQAMLTHGGVNEAAAALGVHRNTVAYRVRRIEATTGWRLTDPDLRAALTIALRLFMQSA
jgi:purine catabolism regulator